MTSRIIPKEELTAYQRWELGGVEGHGAVSKADPAASSQEEPDEPQAVRLPTAAEVEQIHQEAWQEAYKLGLEEGRREGEEYSRRLKMLFEAMEVAKLAQDKALAREVLDLGVAVARQIVSGALQVKPELMLATVREALAQLPHLSGHPKLVAHPSDAALLREWLAQEHGHVNWRVAEDPQMVPGGFRVESAQGELDASMPVRWQEVLLALGAAPAWLE